MLVAGYSPNPALLPQILFVPVSLAAGHVLFLLLQVTSGPQ